MPAKGVHGPVSEFDLIERIARAPPDGPGTELGIGDDAAILRVGADAVVAQDLLVDNVHFRLSTTGARDLGHKALAVNLSDIGAMGVQPIAAFVGLVLPPAGFTDDDFDAPLRRHGGAGRPVRRDHRRRRSDRRHHADPGRDGDRATVSRCRAAAP